MVIILFLVKAIVSFLVFFKGWRMTKVMDAGYMKVVRKYSAGVAAVYIVLAAALVQGGSWGSGILDSFFWASIALAAFCDYNTKQVYDFVYLPAAISGCVSLAFGLSWQGMADLLAFGVIQWVIFRRLYGGADCLAFCVCAVYMAAYGGRLMDYILFMAGVFICLTVKQMARRNVGKDGNLKEGVPLLPYIAAVMLAVMVWR